MAAGDLLGVRADLRDQLESGNTETAQRAGSISGRAGDHGGDLSGHAFGEDLFRRTQFSGSCHASHDPCGPLAAEMESCGRFGC